MKFLFNLLGGLHFLIAIGLFWMTFAGFNGATLSNISYWMLASLAAGVIAAVFLMSSWDFDGVLEKLDAIRGDLDKLKNK